ncbi:hypothetical protein [Hymenobacter properus]|uniref:Uncharacterized protein n=1 Tax=Hymenobacter properus TaxID=2791026 RepID=A0A931FKV6_9BACT|nr:hypothetical protein [Hymenobacter properus]MBF9141406.1 hypothetical protein [Hymenobacter properus]MBR7720215.1 hypothetical protein [Microvirga sp. SRT04]
MPPVLVRRISRRFGLAVLLLVLGSAVAAVAASLSLFTASYDSARVRIDWEVNTEADVTSFDLARKTSTETSYSALTNVTPNGQRRYTFYDANVFRTASGGAPTPALGGGPVTYRLTIHGPGGDQSFLTVLAGTPSSVQRSWGTIKSMFR